MDSIATESPPPENIWDKKGKTKKLPSDVNKQLPLDFFNSEFVITETEKTTSESVLTKICRLFRRTPGKQVPIDTYVLKHDTKDTRSDFAKLHYIDKGIFVASTSSPQCLYSLVSYYLSKVYEGVY